jgi:hypothetical protein
MAESIVEFIGVYDADSTLLGEVSYWIGARFGRTHCSLCDLTHGLFTVKDEWRECERSLGVPFRTFHRNDAPGDVLAVANGSFPVVLTRTGSGLEVALDAVQLARFEGSTARFGAWLGEFLGSR